MDEKLIDRRIESNERREQMMQRRIDSFTELLNAVKADTVKLKAEKSKIKE
jgi:hypothetical protein